jgi:hypothetical protein
VLFLCHVKVSLANYKYSFFKLTSGTFETS